MLTRMADDDVTPNNSSSDDPLNEESLQIILANYKKALEQEFDLEKAPELVDSEILTERIKKQMIGKLPIAVKTLVHLAEHADSENVRLQASKYIVEAAIGKNGMSPIEDPMTAMLKKLAENK